MCNPDFDQLIHDAMAQLRAQPAHFGLTGQSPRKQLELAFQRALGQSLEELSAQRIPRIKWKYANNELCFETRKLTNRRHMKIDVCGIIDDRVVIAIELKYVTSKSQRDCKLPKPNDEAAFAYDVAKDCLKLELLMDGGELFSRDERYPASKTLHPYAIALTNWPRFWALPGENWSRNFQHKLGSENVVLNGRLKVAPTATPINTIYFEENKAPRPHMVLTQEWAGSWEEYAPQEAASPYSRFRYLLLSPRTLQVPEWTHDEPDTMPFDAKCSRCEFDRIANEWSIVKRALKAGQYTPRWLFAPEEPPNRATTLPADIRPAVEGICAELSRMGYPNAARRLKQLLPNDTRMMAAE